MRIVKLWLSFAHVPVVWAAYVQFKPCSDDTQHGVPDAQKKGAFDFDADGFGASIQKLDDQDRSRIQLRILGLRIGASSCDALDDDEEARSSLRLATLGSSRLYAGELGNQTCSQYTENGPPVTTRVFNYDIERPHLLDSFFLTVELEGQNDTSATCIRAPLTPTVDDTVIQLATWGPACILFLVIVAALWRETTNLRPEEESSEEPRRETSRAHVTRIADCISYLQFIFFSSALSLQYPGFLQPVTSRMSWSTLMLPAGVVVRDSWYDGVRDGIYEINGTFGGTAGLELMTQVMGGTVTTDTWLNTVALAALVFMVLTGVVALGQRLTWTRDWFQAKHTLIFRHGQSSFRAIMWTAFRLFCSYLLMPIVAWCAYLASGAKTFPIYYTMAGTAVMCMLVIVTWWTMSQGRPRNMGYLLIDGDEEHRNKTTVSRTRDIYSAGIFAMLFLRGATIGGLQVAGTAQLAILIASEIIQLILHVLVFRAAPYSSRTGAMPLVRLVVFAFATGFLPGAAGHGPKMALGYIILTIHVAMLLLIFLAPTLWDMFTLLKTSFTRVPAETTGSDHGSEPQVFGLRQLMRRPTNPHLIIPPTSPPSTLPPSATTPSPIDGSYYFRPPRLSSAELISRTSMGTPVPESYTSSTSEASISDRSSSSRGEMRNISGHGSSDGSPEGVKAEDGGGRLSPLNPRIDYSVREADKYYVRPRKLSFRKAVELGEEESARKGGFVNRISAFRKPK